MLEENAPCLVCKERQIRCHSTCQRYQNWAALRRKQQAWIKSQSGRFFAAGEKERNDKQGRI